VTVKPLYGKQEGAYNLHTPGSSLDAYLSYEMVGPWVLMGVTEAADNQSNANTTRPGLIGMIERLLAGKRPALVRGDCGQGDEPTVAEFER